MLLPDAPLQNVMTQFFKLLDSEPIRLTGVLNVKFLLLNAPSRFIVSPVFTEEVASPLLSKYVS